MAEQPALADEAGLVGEMGAWALHATIWFRLCHLAGPRTWNLHFAVFFARFGKAGALCRAIGIIALNPPQTVDAVDTFVPVSGGHIWRVSLANDPSRHSSQGAKGQKPPRLLMVLESAPVIHVRGTSKQACIY